MHSRQGHEKRSDSAAWRSDGYPEFFNSTERTVFQRFIIHKDYVEPIMFYREFYGVKKNHVEISEEFRLLINMYFNQRNNSYYAVLDSGNCDVYGL